MKWGEERPAYPPPGKCENIPGDGRRVIIEGKVFIVRSFPTFMKESDAYRRESTKHDELDFDAMAEEMQTL